MENYTSTQVQFPRFQTELSPDKQIWDRTLQHIAEPQCWLTPEQTQGLLAPLEHTFNLPTKTFNQRTRTGWWGEMHWSKARVSEPQEFFSPITLCHETFRSVIMRHEWEWDVQAFPQSGHEIVLQRRDVETEEFEDVAAVFIYPKDLSQQRLVLNSAEGWHEPAEKEADIVGSYLYTLHYLSLADINSAHR